MGDVLSTFSCFGEAPSLWCAVNLFVTSLDIFTDLLFFSALEADEHIGRGIAYGCLLFALCGIVVEVCRYVLACRYNYSYKHRKERTEQQSLARVHVRCERRREMKQLHEDPSIERVLATEGPQRYVRKKTKIEADSGTTLPLKHTGSGTLTMQRTLSRTGSGCLSGAGVGAGAGFIGQDWDAGGSNTVNVLENPLPGFVPDAALLYVAPLSFINRRVSAYNRDEALAAALQHEEEERVGRAAAAAFPRGRLPELPPPIISHASGGTKADDGSKGGEEDDGAPGEFAKDVAAQAAAAVSTDGAQERIECLDIEGEAMNFCCGVVTSYKDADDLEGQEKRGEDGKPERIRG